MKKISRWYKLILRHLCLLRLSLVRRRRVPTSGLDVSPPETRWMGKFSSKQPTKTRILFEDIEAMLASWLFAEEKHFLGLRKTFCGCFFVSWLTNVGSFAEDVLVSVARLIESSQSSDDVYWERFRQQTVETFYCASSTRALNLNLVNLRRKKI